MIFKQFEQSVTVNSIPVLAKITVEVDEDDIDVGDDIAFGNASEEARYIARFKSGELFLGIITVRAQALGEEGIDSLGACHLFSNNMFNHEPFNNSVERVLEDHAMIEQALGELVRAIESAANRLAPFATK